MKRFILLILCAMISIISLPLALLRDKPVQVNPEETTETEETVQEPQNSITVFRATTQEKVEVDLFEYVCGSVAAEMPLSYHDEALKAQAIACFTNALRLRESSGREDYHITDSSATHQGYINEDERREKWGDDFEKYNSKLKNIVSQVENQALYYDSNLCIAAFFAISSGKTENAEDVWGEKVPYLVSVKSNGDKLSPNYIQTVSFDKEEIRAILNNLEIKEKFTELKNIIKITDTTKNGYVLKGSLNGKALTGEEIRNAFSLKSCNFTVDIKKDSVIFTVYGYGHGIGMSQYGADFMARQGATYKEILHHYYKGAEIKEYTV